jgi:hypothetical protein
VTGRDPVRDAWEAAGCPEAVPADAGGQCARCGTAGPVTRWRDVLSANFGDWDRLRWRDSGAFCPACAWAFGHKPLRTRAHVIAPGRVTLAAPGDLLAALSAPVGMPLLVVVPVAGKKHIAPWAPYGVVATDHEQLRWTGADAGRLAVLARLRGAGFGEAALGEPAPRWMILRNLDPAGRADAVTAWAALAPWRDRPAYLAVACRATRTPKGQKEDAGA